jgi:hypothetical protein
MPIRTLTTIKRNRSRAECHQGAAARIIAKMRQGATLHQHSRMRGRFGPCRTAPGSTPTFPKSLPAISTVAGVVDRLFPRATAVSQTFRWSD